MFRPTSSECYFKNLSVSDGTQTFTELVVVVSLRNFMQSHNTKIYHLRNYRSL